MNILIYLKVATHGKLGLHTQFQNPWDNHFWEKSNWERKKKRKDTVNSGHNILPAMLKSRVRTSLGPKIISQEWLINMKLMKTLLKFHLNHETCQFNFLNFNSYDVRLLNIYFSSEWISEFIRGSLKLKYFWIQIYWLRIIRIFKYSNIFGHLLCSASGSHGESRRVKGSSSGYEGSWIVVSRGSKGVAWGIQKSQGDFITIILFPQRMQWEVGSGDQGA